jgi:hypothetical protein
VPPTILKRSSSLLSLKSAFFAKNILKKIYHLGTCTTCQGIIKETTLEKKGFEMQDIKFDKITAG